jgi:hypothetical protein
MLATWAWEERNDGRGGDALERLHALAKRAIVGG